MRGLFESVTRVAIEEILKNHTQPSKFGLLVTPESFQELTEDLYNLLVTSRELKSAGDRLVGGTGTGAMGGVVAAPPASSKRGASR